MCAEYCICIQVASICITGGMKIWECSVDLVRYMNEAQLLFFDKRVLEVCI